MMCRITTTEITYGWRLKDYFAFAAWKFSNRQLPWKLKEGETDEAVGEPDRPLACMCFSSQYYFTMFMASFSIMMLAFGVEIMLRKSYNMFADPIFVPLSLIIVAVCVSNTSVNILPISLLL